MSELTIDVLKQICEKLPDDFSVEFVDHNGINYLVSDVVEVDVTNKKLVLKS